MKKKLFDKLSKILEKIIPVCSAIMMVGFSLAFLAMVAVFFSERIAEVLLMISAVLMFAPALFMIWAAMIMIFLDSDDYEPPLIYHPIYYRKKY